ncbi:MAG: guanylate kinase [Defluviitaleaceae bacterium]|nr:guanylate kinase [Defluviitaleaceae bacterium]
MDEGLLLILSGPSGSGKGTIIRNLMNADEFALSVSMTTRAPRPGETEGVEYLFRSQDEFLKTIDNDGFLEYATFSGNYYGTPTSYVDEKMAQGKTVLLEIDVMGALQVKKKKPDAVLIFLVPPTFEILRERLLGRGTESVEEVARRNEIAWEELRNLPEYDYLVINDFLGQALDEICTIIRAEKLRIAHAGCKIKRFYGNNLEKLNQKD